MRNFFAAVGLGFVLSCTSASGDEQTCVGGKFAVAIDIGHSKLTPGALSATGKSEYFFNRRFAVELLARADAWPGLTLILLDDTGSQIGLRQRALNAARSGAKVLLSIHHDSVNQKYMRTWERDGRKLQYSDAFSGFSLFVSEDSNHFVHSYALAKAISHNLVLGGRSPTLHHAELIPGESRKLLDVKLGIYGAPFAILRSSTLPAVLFEVGVIANRTEEQSLEDPKYRAQVQAAVLKGLSDYCRATR